MRFSGCLWVLVDPSASPLWACLASNGKIYGGQPSQQAGPKDCGLGRLGGLCGASQDGLLDFSRCWHFLFLGSAKTRILCLGECFFGKVDSTFMPETCQTGTSAVHARDYMVCIFDDFTKYTCHGVAQY